MITIIAIAIGIFILWLLPKFVRSFIAHDFEKEFDNANAAFESGQYELSISILNKAIYKFPDNYQLYNNRGEAKWQLDMFEEALGDFIKSYELLPDLNRNLKAYMNIEKAKFALEGKAFFIKKPSATMVEFAEHKQTNSKSEEEAVRSAKEMQDQQDKATYFKRKRAEAAAKAAKAADEAEAVAKLEAAQKQEKEANAAAAVAALFARKKREAAAKLVATQTTPATSKTSDRLTEEMTLKAFGQYLTDYTLESTKFFLSAADQNSEGKVIETAIFCSVLIYIILQRIKMDNYKLIQKEYIRTLDHQKFEGQTWLASRRRSYFDETWNLCKNTNDLPLGIVYKIYEHPLSNKDGVSNDVTKAKELKEKFRLANGQMQDWIFYMIQPNKIAEYEAMVQEVSALSKQNPDKFKELMALGAKTAKVTDDFYKSFPKFENGNERNPSQSNGKVLYFKDMNGAGEVICKTCKHTESITAFLHNFDDDPWSSSGYQCQACGKFSTFERLESQNVPVKLVCSCGGELSDNQPVFCPKCKSKDVVYDVSIMM